MVSESESLVLRIARESIWGKRGLLKANSLWLPLALMFTAKAYDTTQGVVGLCFQVFFAVACWASAVILANDLTDRQYDRGVGKERWILRLPDWAGTMVVALLFLAGLTVITLSKCLVGALWAYIGAMALGLSYSFKPVRFKERGCWGLLAYSVACAFAYVMVPWSCLQSNLVVLVLLAPAVFLNKWVNLHFHQVIDYGSDRGAGIRTYAVAGGLAQARRSLRWIEGIASLWFLVVLGYVIFLVPSWRIAILLAAGVVVLGSYANTQRAFLHSDEKSALVRELSWLYLGLSYAIFYVLPVVLLLRLTLSDSSVLVVFCVAVFLLLLETWHLVRYRYE